MNAQQTAKRLEFREIDGVLVDGDYLNTLDFISLPARLEKYFIDYDIFNNAFRISDENQFFITETKANKTKFRKLRTAKNKLIKGANMRFEKTEEKRVNAEQLKEYAKTHNLTIDNQTDRIFLLDEMGNLMKIVEKEDDSFIIYKLKNKF